MTVDDTHAMKLLEGFGHGGWAWLVLTGCDVSTNVHRHLNGPGQVERDDVLQVEVIGQLFGIKRLLGFNAHQATAQRFEFLVDHLCIHACLLSCSMRAW
jgi:hypothetical protein